MNFEEAKQQVAEEAGYDDFVKAIYARADSKSPLTFTELINKAAELWQSENLKRIAELESHIESIIEAYDKIDNIGSSNLVLKLFLAVSKTKQQYKK